MIVAWSRIDFEELICHSSCQGRVLDFCIPCSMFLAPQNDKDFHDPKWSHKVWPRWRCDSIIYFESRRSSRNRKLLMFVYFPFLPFSDWNIGRKLASSVWRKCINKPNESDVEKKMASPHTHKRQNRNVRRNQSRPSFPLTFVRE